MSRGGTSSFVALAILFTARVCLAEGGAPGCEGSDGCAAPTPYCHPTLHACVECQSSLNCTGDRVCDEATGACVACTGDGDCGQSKPYCVEGACMECRSDANCAADGLRCVSGTCGRCGDGVCSARERVAVLGRTFSLEPKNYEACADDCESECGDATLKLNEKATIEVGSRNAFEGPCAFASADATLSFTAPEAARYWFTVKRQDEASVGYFFFIQVLRGACPAVSFDDCASGETEGFQKVDISAGETVTVLIDAAEPGTYDVSVSTQTPPCRGSFCVPPVPDASVPGDTAAARCLESARDRGEGACDGVQCACSHCPRDYDDCQIIPGCAAVNECMRERSCTGDECLTASTCERVINTHGGKGAPAFRAAKALRACTEKNACVLPCTDGGAPADAGAAVCLPGDERTCSCGDGGTGEQRCDAEGSGYGACRCEQAAPPAASDSSCDCGLARGGSSGAGVVAALGLAAAAFGRRSRRSPRAVRSESAGGGAR